MLIFLVFGHSHLSSFTSDSSSQLDVFWHDGDSLGVDSAKVGVLKESNQVGFTSFLQSHDGAALESKIGFEILSNFSDQSLEWKLSDEQFGGFLVSSDFSESDGSWSESVWLFDTAGGWSGFSGSFGGELLSWGFTSSGFSSGLFSSSHFRVVYLRLSGSK